MHTFRSTNRTEVPTVTKYQSSRSVLFTSLTLIRRKTSSCDYITITFLLAFATDQSQTSPSHNLGIARPNLNSTLHGTLPRLVIFLINIWRQLQRQVLVSYLMQTVWGRVAARHAPHGFREHRPSTIGCWSRPAQLGPVSCLPGTINYGGLDHTG